MAKLDLHPSLVIGEVSPLLFGGFLEHMGRSIYEGVYDPQSAHADADGCRTDVIAALRELEMTVVRYPGGNFVSGYHWQDGVGPVADRPTVRELAWQSIEPNRFGTDEFMGLCRKLDWAPMLAVNLGTGTPEEARDWVEYCNATTGTRFADMRSDNGTAEPHAVPYWCLGNEMDGPWQLGHVPADQYAIRAQQAAKMMRDCDPTIQTVACGSSGTQMSTYLEWDRAVLEHVGDLADYVSLHRYVGNRRGDSPSYLATGISIDQQIEAVDACCRYVQAKSKSPKRTYLCFDEWNVWYKARTRAHMDGKGQFAPHLVEERYNLEDALVVAGFLMSFLRHADCVRIANLAQLVNVIGPILTEGDRLLKQSIFYAFRAFSTRKGGVSLATAIDGPRYECYFGDVHTVDAAATLDGKTLHVFAVNRDITEATPLTVQLAGRGIVEVLSSEILTAPALDVENTFDSPETVVPRSFGDWSVPGGASAGAATTELPPRSLVATSFAIDA